MTRNRRSAREAGTKFERSVADCLAEHVDDRIDRRPRRGAKDRGDIGGLRSPHDHRIVVEAKDNGGQIKAAAFVTQAEIERGNDDAIAGLSIVKRRGHSDPLDQYVLMTVRDLVAILIGTRPKET